MTEQATSSVSDQGSIEFVGWLAKDLIWVEGWTTLPPGASLSVRLPSGIWTEVEGCEQFRYPRPDLQNIPYALGHVLILRTAYETFPNPFTEELEIAAEGRRFVWQSGGVVPVMAEISSRLPSFRGMDSVVRADLFRLLVGFAKDARCTSDLVFSPNLAAVLQEAVTPEGFQDFAVWISRGLLLVRGWLKARDREIEAAYLLAKGWACRLETELIGEYRTDLPNPDWGKVFLFRFPLHEFGRLSDPAVVVACRRGYIRLTHPSGLVPGLRIDDSLVPAVIETPANREFGGKLRERILREADFEQAEIRDDILDHNLTFLREKVAQALTPYLEVTDRSFCMSLESFVPATGNSAFLSGWIWDAAGQLATLQVASPDGAAADVSQSIVWRPRADVAEAYRGQFGSRAGEKHGLLGFVALPPSRYWEHSARLQATLSDGRKFEVSARAMSGEAVELQKAVLSALPQHPYLDENLFEHHIQPVVSLLQEERRRTARVTQILEFGSPPANPEVSIIVTLFRRLDLFRHQIALFCEDPDLASCELIYVLDSPELAEELEKLGDELYRLYRVPFRLVFLNRNLGFAGSNNAGAKNARGRYLLFLNSDIFPSRHGWICSLKNSLASRPDAGIAGTKLLFEDDSLQHAGMFFHRDYQPAGFWWNGHYFKGLPAEFPPANAARNVPAITGACLLLRRELFEMLDGWDELYIHGDFEDSDLCLKAFERGYRSWYLPLKGIYHLERTSQGPVFAELWRQNASYYNCWLHTKRWNSLIEEVMASSDSSVEASGMAVDFQSRNK